MSCRRAVWNRRGILPQGLSLVLAILLITTPISGLAAADESSGAVGAGLSVASDPVGAIVYVDGQFIGETPVSVDRLSAGDHRVRVVKTGYLENARIVNVSAGKTSSVEVKLTKDANATNTQIISGTGGGGGMSKWVWLGIAGGGAAAAAAYFLTRNSPPIAGTISASPATALQGGTTVTLTSQGASDPDGDPLTFSWTFGDGGSGTGQTVTHVYGTSGTMNVELTVSDGKKSATATTTVTVRSLSGTWRGSVGGAFTSTVNLTQSGTSATGNYSDTDGFTATVSGTVSTSAPIVRLTINYGFGFIGTFNLNPNADVNSLTGTYAEPGFGPVNTTLTRQ